MSAFGYNDDLVIRRDTLERWLQELNKKGGGSVVCPEIAALLNLEKGVRPIEHLNFATDKSRGLAVIKVTFHSDSYTLITLEQPTLASVIESLLACQKDLSS